MSAAFFDLDGTLTVENTGRLWFRRERAEGRLHLSQAMEAGFWLGLYGVGLMRADVALSRAVGTLAGLEEDALEERIARFYAEEVEASYAPGGLEAVKRHKEAGDKVVLLTAASVYLARCVQNTLGLDDVLALRFEVGADGRFTGGLQQPVCYGPGKLELAHAWASSHGVDLADCSFYTDSISDLPMLDAVGTPVAVRPDGRLTRVAKRRGWAIEDWGGDELISDEEAEEIRSGRLRQLAASAVRRVSRARSRVTEARRGDGATPTEGDE
jgi:HAD superfamily hydrolase (TIGR01490 family)